MSEPFEINEKVNAMWLALADQISAAIPDCVIAGKPVEAIHWATCAEACFWKATGDSDSHDVKDVMQSYDAGRAALQEAGR